MMIRLRKKNSGKGWDTHLYETNIIKYKHIIQIYKKYKYKNLKPIGRGQKYSPKVCDFRG